MKDTVKSHETLVSERLAALEQENNRLKGGLSVAPWRMRLFGGIVAAFILTTLLVVMATPARAQASGSIAARVDALEARMAAVESVNASQANQIAALQSALAAETAARQASDDALQTNLTAEASSRQSGDAGLGASIGAETSARQAADSALQSNINSEAAARSASDALFGGRCASLEAKTIYMSVVGSETYFTGTNLNIRNGMGATESQNGLGNLTIGYNELRNNGSDDHSGSHYLILGIKNSYANYAGAVFGHNNSSEAPYASVLGGGFNGAIGFESTISGGQGNTAGGTSSSISGGKNNTANGNQSSISGGNDNLASFYLCSISGGSFNTASGESSVISGGAFITQISLHGWSGGAYHTP